jgi:Holliday junction resolvase
MQEGNDMKWTDDRPASLESDIQAKIIDHAWSRGWFCVKTETRSMRGLMDVVAIRRGRTIWIEVKRTGEGPRRQQEIRAQEMRDHGAEVFIVDTYDEARGILH